MVTINRPNKANAYDGFMLKRLAELVPKLEETARVVVFRSSDPRFFCAGADMERIANPSARDALELESQVSKWSCLSTVVWWYPTAGVPGWVCGHARQPRQSSSRGGSRA